MDDQDKPNLGNDEPIEFGDDDDDLVPFYGDDDKTEVSHKPLDLSKPGSKIKYTKKPEHMAPAGTIVSDPNRITGTRTFFTKLHAGAVDFLNDQINDWIKANPGANIKQTNTTTGMVVAKKTEPNLIITVWY